MLREPEHMPGITVVTAKHFADERGFLLQSWVRQDLEAAGIPSDFAQAIQTVSKRGVEILADPRLQQESPLVGEVLGGDDRDARHVFRLAQH